MADVRNVPFEKTVTEIVNNHQLCDVKLILDKNQQWRQIFSSSDYFNMDITKFHIN